MRFRAFPAIALLLCASEAAAQKGCTKGIPCGGTCISATKTCQVGMLPAVVPTPVPDNPSAVVSSVLQPRVMLAGEPIVFVGGKRREFHTTPDTMAPWAAGVDGITYYRRECYVARGVLPGGHVYFKTEADAYASAYRRSVIPGC